MLLAGLALENLIKGILIGRNPEKFPPKSKSGGIQSHDLSKLIQQAGILLNAYEQQLVQRLTQFTTWTGRYPTPLHAGGMAPWRTPAMELGRPDGGREVVPGHTELPGVVYARDPVEVDLDERRSPGDAY